MAELSTKQASPYKRIEPFTLTTKTKLIALVAVVYTFYAVAQLNVSFARFATGLGNAAQFLGRMFPPNFDRIHILTKGLIESLEIAVLASAAGILIAIPLGLFGARNLMPSWITWPTRAFISMCRALHPVIVSILFVKAVGFGALAGILALTVASVGFIGKLFTESIEEISLKQVEAIRSTGASFANVMIFAVIPQVFGRFIGFCTYQFDSNLRNSTMVGIVGAGGIGGTLFSAFQRFDYDFVCAILISIITIIMLGEMLASLIRSVFLDNINLRQLFGRQRQFQRPSGVRA